MDARRVDLGVRELGADEAAVGLGRRVLVAGHEAGLHPDRLVGVRGVQDLPAAVVPLDPAQGDRAAGAEVEPQEGVRGLRPVLVGEEQGPPAVRGGEDRPHDPEARLEVVGVHRPLRQRVAVEELDELGERAPRAPAAGPRETSPGTGSRPRPSRARRRAVAWRRGRTGSGRSGRAPRAGSAPRARATGPRAARRGSGTPRGPARGGPAPRPPRSARAARSPLARRAGRRAARTGAAGAAEAGAMLHSAPGFASSSIRRPLAAMTGAGLAARASIARPGRRRARTTPGTPDFIRRDHTFRGGLRLRPADRSYNGP